MSEVTDVVDRQVAAYRDRNLERFLACYAADVKVTVEYIRDSDGNVIKRLVRDINCRYGDCPGSEVPPHWR